MGTTVEFQPRGSFLPLVDMLGGGPFRLNPGEWTDDTSMALCLAASLLESNGFDANDQMERYLRWCQCGYMSSNGRGFDIGNTTQKALTRFKETGEPLSGPTDPYSAGNGSIMRLAPVILFYYPDHDLIWRYAAESSRTTHGAVESIEACRLLGSILNRILQGAGKEEALWGKETGPFTSASIQDIASGAYRTKSLAEIQGTGYAVKSLEAALWCFLTTRTFEAAILKSANLGDDADTTAAICGQVAGAYYGETGIPSHWIERLAMRQEIAGFADQLYARQSPA